MIAIAAMSTSRPVRGFDPSGTGLQGRYPAYNDDHQCLRCTAQPLLRAWRANYAGLPPLDL